MSDAPACTFESLPGLGGPGPLFFSYAIGSLLYGGFTTIFAMSMYILLRKGLKSMSNIVVFTTIIVMYTVSMIYWIGVTIFAWQILSLSRLSPHLAGFMVTAIDFLPPINFMLGDAIVVWRAWLVWNRSIFALLVPVVLFVGSIATSMVYIVTSAWNVERGGIGVLCTVRDLRLGGLPVTYTLALATNVYATSLVPVKAWCYRRNVKQHLSAGNRRTLVEAILILLIESGSVYCAILAAAAACVWSGNMYASLFMNPILAQITASSTSSGAGIYPTIIIVLASFQKTHCDRNFTYGMPIAFVSPPLARTSRDAATFDLASAISTIGPRRPSADGHLQTSAEDVVIDVDQE